VNQGTDKMGKKASRPTQNIARQTNIHPREGCQERLLLCRDGKSLPLREQTWQIDEMVSKKLSDP
jgi:hypothetical protein